MKGFVLLGSQTSCKIGAKAKLWLQFWGFYGASSQALFSACFGDIFLKVCEINAYIQKNAENVNIFSATLQIRFISEELECKQIVHERAGALR